MGPVEWIFRCSLRSCWRQVLITPVLIWLLLLLWLLLYIEHSIQTIQVLMDVRFSVRQRCTPCHTVTICVTLTKPYSTYCISHAGMFCGGSVLMHTTKEMVNTFEMDKKAHWKASCLWWGCSVIGVMCRIGPSGVGLNEEPGCATIFPFSLQLLSP